jgi:hypothetical protein
VVEIGAAIEFAAFYDGVNALSILDAVERVCVQEDEIGKLARFANSKVGRASEGRWLG